LANTGAAPIALGGWMLDDGAGGGAPYTIAPDSIVGPHALFVVTLPRALFNNAGDEVRLIRPDGSVVDQFSYVNSAVDLSFCRFSSGWADGSPPSPNEVNQCDHAQAAPDATQRVLLPPSQSLATAVPLSGTDTLTLTTLPTPRQPAWSSEDTVGATPYALSGGGQLYRGLGASSPTRQPTASPTPTLGPRSAPIRQSAPANLLLLFSWSAGIMLTALSAVIVGYTQLRVPIVAPGVVVPAAPDAETSALQSDS
jgi:hypothetical protein